MPIISQNILNNNSGTTQAAPSIAAASLLANAQQFAPGYKPWGDPPQERKSFLGIGSIDNHLPIILLIVIIGMAYFFIKHGK